MYSSDQQPFVIGAIILLYGLPIFASLFHNGFFKSFQTKSLIRGLNQAFIVLLIIGLVLAVVGKILDKTVFARDAGNSWMGELTMGVIYTFWVIGIMIYVPIVILVNLVRWLWKTVNRLRGL